MESLRRHSIWHYALHMHSKHLLSDYWRWERRRSDVAKDPDPVGVVHHLGSGSSSWWLPLSRLRRSSCCINIASTQDWDRAPVTKVDLMRTQQIWPTCLFGNVVPSRDGMVSLSSTKYWTEYIGFPNRRDRWTAASICVPLPFVLPISEIPGLITTNFCLSFGIRLEVVPSGLGDTRRRYRM